jgi:hypothetical protein
MPSRITGQRRAHEHPYLQNNDLYLPLLFVKSPICLVWFERISKTTICTFLYTVLMISHMLVWMSLLKKHYSYL